MCLGHRTPKKGVLNTLIIGCGYLGQALAQSWLGQSIPVTGWVRTETAVPDLNALGVHPFIGDVASVADWSRIENFFDLVVYCPSSNRGGVEAYRSVFVEGLCLALQKLPSSQLLFISSTSVYGQDDGSLVDEQSPAEPTSQTSRILREAEEIGFRAGAIILRVAGIYGPGRGVLVRKFLDGQAVIEGDGSRWMNQIHRDDVISAIQTLVQHGRRGEVYNICDNVPSSHLEFYQWLANRYQLPLPPFGPPNIHRKRGTTNKRVQNAKLRSLGWSPQYPDFREGLRSTSNL